LNGIAVLPKVYAGYIDGQDAAANQRISGALDGPPGDTGRVESARRSCRAAS
jgi:hypothetical protein